MQLVSAPTWIYLSSLNLVLREITFQIISKSGIPTVHQFCSHSHLQFFGNLPGGNFLRVFTFVIIVYRYSFSINKQVAYLVLNRTYINSELSKLNNTEICVLRSELAENHLSNRYRCLCKVYSMEVMARVVDGFFVGCKSFS